VATVRGAVRDYQKYAITLAVFAAALYAALIVAGLGVVSLLTNTDVIVDPLAGPLVGPSMVLAAAVFVTFRMVLIGVRTRPERQRVMLGYALVTGIASGALFIVVGGVLYLLGSGDLPAATDFSAALLIGPFPLLTGIFGFIVTLLYSWLLAAHVGQGGRPLWPWERSGE